jgi:hypothetical protein
MTATGVVIANHRDLRTEKLTVVTLVAQATVEAAFGHHGRELEIVSIEVQVADDSLVA